MTIRINPLPAAVLLAAVLLPICANAASIWASKPQPKFPEASLRKGSEGYVVVRAYIQTDGRVTRATIAKTSGDAILDEAARTAVLKWKMNAAAVKPNYLTNGYDQRIDFRPEAPIAARYSDRAAYFGSFQSARIWTYAPFPEYPAHERLVKAEGVVYIKITIRPDGGVASAEVVRSSGYPSLDKAALEAIHKWHAHREFAGKHGVMPVHFTLHSVR